MVHLEGESPPLRYRDPFDAIRGPVLKPGIRAPWAVLGQVAVSPGIPFLPQEGHRLFRLVCPLPRGNEGDISGIDDRGVMDADRDHEVITNNEVSGGIKADILAPHRILLPVLLKDRVKCIERAEIVPPGLKGNHGGTGGLLHQSVVNRDGGDLPVCFLQWSRESPGDIGGVNTTFLEEEPG